MVKTRIGVWLVGAKGGVASTTIVGLIALKKRPGRQRRSHHRTAPFADLDLPAWGELVVGGHEIRRASLVDEAQRLVTESRTVSPDLFARCKGELAQIDARLRPGTIINVGPTIAELCDADVPRKESPREAVERLRREFADFAAAEKLDHTIVVNVASTEPAFTGQLPPTWAELQRLLDKPRACPLPASSLYAIAALDLGCSYINFTPSLGSAPAAIDELARLRGTRHYGCDGKTGETLLKSVLGADVRPAESAGAQLGRAQHLRQHGRPGAERSGRTGRRRSRAKTICSARSSATGRRRTSRSSTSRAWAIGRRRGTTSISPASWACRWCCNSSGRDAIRCWLRRWCIDLVRLDRGWPAAAATSGP